MQLSDNDSEFFLNAMEDDSPPNEALKEAAKQFKQRTFSIPEMIDDATELIRNGWVQGHLALDHEGKSCAPESDMACKWCEWGAVMAVTRGRSLPDEVADYINDLVNMANSEGERYEQYRQKEGAPAVTFSWNDSRTTYEEVVQRFENARKFVRDNPQLAKVPKYTQRSFLKDD